MNALRALALVLVVLGCSPAPAPANPLVSETSLPKESSMTAGPVALTEFQVFGAADAVQLSSVTAADGKPAHRAEVKRGFPNPWDVQLGAKVQEAVARGDTLLATFRIRTAWIAAETGEGQSEFVVELAREPWTKAVTRRLVAGADWKEFTIAFESPRDFAPGDAQVLFRLGYGPQILELSEVRLEKHKKTRTLAELRARETRETYPGIEPDAHWREAARARIDALRKADLSVVVEQQGKAVPNARVVVEQLGHSFGIGTCAPANVLIDPKEEHFREIVKTHFNTVTLENDLKWVALAGDWGPTFELDNAKQAVTWLREQGIAVRGHVLVWPGWQHLPKWLKEHEEDPPRLRAEVEKRIRDAAGAMKGTLAHWDVVNEPFDNHDLMDLFGNDILIDWFRLARATDPGPKLFLNDYGILPGGALDTPHRRHFEETIAFLLEKGAPLDGIGMQGHFGSSLTSPDDLLRLLDRYGRFGKPLWITEYDLVIDDEELAANYTRDFYTVLFSHAAVEGVVMWGFTDRLHWKKNAVMFREDWSLKPAGKVFQELFGREWRTRAELQTDVDGLARTRGFHGRYRIHVTAGAGQREVTTELEKGGREVIVVLP